MESDAEFFARRAAEERAAAEKATDKNATESHLELARTYEAVSAALALVPGIGGVTPKAQH